MTYPSTSNANGIWTLRDVFLARKENIWPVTTLYDEYFSDVALLLQDSESDESANQITLTYTNASVTDAVSKVGTKSIYLTGISSTVVFPRSPAWFEGRDFTIECWAMFPNYSGAANYQLFRGGTIGPFFLILSDKIRISRSSVVIADSATLNLEPNTWYHFALTRRDNGSGNSDYYEAFVDGVSVATGTRVESFTNTQDGKFGEQEMYIDAYRITDGTARYTTSFTPSTETFPTSSPP